MTTYSAIGAALLAIGAAARSSTLTTLRDNPIAISEGSTSAPVLSTGWHPVDMVTVGDGNDGNIYAGTSVNTIESDTFVDGYEYMFIGKAVGHDEGSWAQNLTLELYLETTAAYDTAITTLTPAILQTGTIDFLIYLPLVRSVQTFHRIHAGLGRTDGSTYTWTDLNVSDGQASATAQPISKMRFSLDGNNNPNFDEGNIYQYRRREFSTG